MKVNFTIEGPPIGKARPRVTRTVTYTPAKNHSLPEFVQKRIDWVSNEIQGGMLTFRGAFKMLLDIDDEEDLKKDWEFGASSDYMPVSDEYRNWLNDPILGNIRSVALMIAVIYG